MSQQGAPKIDDTDDPGQPPVSQAVAVYFHCARFIAAQTLRKKLESQKKLCSVHVSETLVSICEGAKKTGGIIIFHLAQENEVSPFMKFLNDLDEPLGECRVSIVVVSRVRVKQIQDFLTSYPNIFVLPTTVALADLEKKVGELIRRLAGGQTAGRKPKDVTQVSPQTQRRAPTASQGTAIVFKGKTIKSFVAIEKGHGRGKLLTAIQSNAKFEWGKNSSPSSAMNAKTSASLPQRTSASTPASLALPVQPPIAGQASIGKGFQLVEDLDQRRRLLMDCFKSRASVLVTQGSCDLRLNAKVVNYDPTLDRMRCLLRAPLSSIKEFRNQKPDRAPLIITASLQQSRLFMAATQVNWFDQDPPTIEFNIPKQLYFIQRRKNFRLTLFPRVSDVVFVSLSEANEEIVSFPIFDVSEGGLALLATQDDLEKLRKSAKLRNLRIQCDEVRIECPEASRRHITPMELGTRSMLYRVGYQFSDLDTESRARIAEFIERSCQDYLLTFFASKPSK